MELLPRLRQPHRFGRRLEHVAARVGRRLLVERHEGDAGARRALLPKVDDPRLQVVQGLFLSDDPGIEFLPVALQLPHLFVEFHEQGSLAKVYRKEIELPLGEKLLVKGMGE